MVGIFHIVDWFAAVGIGVDVKRLLVVRALAAMKEGDFHRCRALLARALDVDHFVGLAAFHVQDADFGIADTHGEGQFLVRRRGLGIGEVERRGADLKGRRGCRREVEFHALWLGIEHHGLLCERLTAGTDAEGGRFFGHALGAEGDGQRARAPGGRQG